jgi:hypothetical protein
MSFEYVIKGESGKTLDASDHALGSDLKAVNATLRFENLGPDVLQWTCRTEDLDAGDSIIPDVGQRVELWIPAFTIIIGGTPVTFPASRQFRGWVTQARTTNYGVQVVAEGPWQFLQKIDITSSVSSGTNTDTRPTIVFNESTVKANIEALLNRAIALGAPMIIGTIATTFTIPKLQLSMMTCADVLAELMRWVPDCVGWWDYTGAGEPIFNLSRRTGMSAVTYTVGTSQLVDFDLTGRPDLKPSQVVIKYTRRRLSPADGRPEFAEQAAGSAVTGRIQTIGLSGKELDTFLPPDDYQTFIAQTKPLNTSTNIRNAIIALIPQVAESRKNFSNSPREGTTDVTLANGESLWFFNRTPVDSFTSHYSLKQSAPQVRDAATGTVITSFTGKNLVIKADTPDWATRVYENAQKVKVTGRIYRVQIITTRTSFNATPVKGAVEPLWSQAFPWVRQDPTGYFSGTEQAPGGKQDSADVSLLYLDFEVDAILTTSTYSSPQTIYKVQDYDYLAPPASLASDLLSAQNFDPYEGSIRLVLSNLGGLTNYLQYKYRISGAQTGLATADALPRAVTWDIAGQSLDIEIGAPARFAFGVLGGKVRQTPQTNITIN